MEKFEIISPDFYSNCLIEALKAKLKNWRGIKLTYVSPFDNEVFCPHILWSDGKYDYDFGNEGKGDIGILNWTLHKGHIRKRALGFNQKYKNTCMRWARKHKKKRWRYKRLKRCCGTCLYRQKLKSYDAEVVSGEKSQQLHSRCGMDDTIHKTNKEQRGCTNYKKKEDY